jgi:hypothetical protein
MHSLWIIQVIHAIHLSYCNGFGAWVSEEYSTLSTTVRCSIVWIDGHDIDKAPLMSTPKRRIGQLHAWILSPFPLRPETASRTCSIWSYFGHKGVTGRGIVSASRGSIRVQVYGGLTGEQRVDLYPPLEKR